MRSQKKPPIHLAHTRELQTLVPEAALANAIDGTLRDFQPAEQTDAFQLEQTLILALAYRLEAKCIFEFGPFDNSRTAPLSQELEEDVSTVITDQSKSGDMSFRQQNIAGLLTPEAIARTEVIRHIDTLHGADARLAYAMYIGQCDLVVVDATHDLDAVRCDSLTALHLVKPGGVVLWTDYGVVDGVTQCLNELHHSMPRLRSLRHISGTNLCIWRRAD